ncbi:MAG: phospholipase D-like domain-containing protein, partial [Gammaproteobacteria bacterium]|nr:phospholipase D-like domain-containing protein [Gammaproteobacteria bacterium]
MSTEILVSIAGVAYLCIQLLAFAAAIYALMTTRTSQGAIAWSISLVAMPLVSLPLYLIFGRGKFAGYVKARKAEDATLQSFTPTALDQKSSDHRMLYQAHDEKYTALEHLAGGSFTQCNSASLLINGKATFDAIFAGIEQATQYILIQFFIVKDDSLGRELHSRLAAKAKEGVQVYFLYDFIGSHGLPVAYLDSLSAAGVQVEAFRSSAGHVRKFQINFRNHRKIVVIDGHTAYLGGHNVGDEYVGKHQKLSPWRDTHVKISGPAVLDIQLAFIEDWNWARQTVPELNWEP